MPRISPKSLKQSLRGLERSSLVSRTVYDGSQRRVEYALTTSAAACWRRSRRLVLGWPRTGRKLLDAQEAAVGPS
ncbi:hypothetical protein GCM10010277_69700 [Streptomyces longisporoflavus]|uniref:winged helix-turn-helix transcriptional regulator n=1 Tax=Streptomyces longisporoflavus TaxID=28044 RepID=UPI0019BDCD51|nr:winged helix-turn-helix transcriptional regulator [Streptomyces longisporoflavus]GGV63548.1 hypothetical protein GCM10010277_69700 [Streptomyces longisporoflavus]